MCRLLNNFTYYTAASYAILHVSYCLKRKSRPSQGGFCL
jgi:hypothetical protein